MLIYKGGHMATNIKTVMTYPLDGSTTDFNIPFEYLARKFVRVTLIGVDRKELILNQDYRFATKTTISTTRALGPADGYTLIEIRRFTSATDRLVDFTDGSILRAYDLNISQVQTLHVAEEARDLTADTIGVNNDGNLDARGRRIVNVADAQDVGDAINLGQIQRWNDSALNSANRAKAEADRATQQADRALAQANRAESDANRAGTHSQEAGYWANWSAAWATQETPVAGDLESSRTYAIQARTHRDAAKVSEDNAKVSETNAKTSETNAAASAVTAKNEADRSTSEADRAKSEADKLENNNKLAGVIQEIDEHNNRVFWKGEGWFPHGPRSYALGDRERFAEWNAYPLGDDATAVEVVANHKGSRKPVFTYRDNDNVMQWDNVDVSTGIRRSEITEQSWVIGPGWAGAGAYNQQYANNDAPFMKRASHAAPQGYSVYHPIAKGIVMTEGYGYGTSFSLGMTTIGDNQFAKGNLVICGDSGVIQTWTFAIDGSFETGAGVYISPNGNIKGDIWGGWLGDWINNNFAARSAYAVNRGWSEAWSGSAGGGVTMQLNQDIRFRQCWIRINDRLISHYFGHDGEYHVQGWGAGWIHLRLQANGTQLVNIQDAKSVPTQIVVQN
jgi:hypothetical protein